MPPCPSVGHLLLRALAVGGGGGFVFIVFHFVFTSAQVGQLQQGNGRLPRERRGPVHRVRAAVRQQPVGDHGGLHGVELRGGTAADVRLRGAGRQAAAHGGRDIRERGHHGPVQGDVPGGRGVPVPVVRLQRDGRERVPHIAPKHVQPVAAGAAVRGRGGRHHVPDVLVLQREDRLPRHGHGRVRAHQPAVRRQGVRQEQAQHLRERRQEHARLRPAPGLPRRRLRRPAGSPGQVLHRDHHPAPRPDCHGPGHRAVGAVLVRPAEPERGPGHRAGHGAGRGARGRRHRGVGHTGRGGQGRGPRRGRRRRRRGGDGVRDIADGDDEDHEPGGRRHTRGAGGRPAEPAVPHTRRPVAVRDIRARADRPGRRGHQRDTADRPGRLSHGPGHHGSHIGRGHRVRRHRQDTRGAVRRVQVPHLGHCPVQGAGHAVPAQVRADQLQRGRPQRRHPPGRLFRQTSPQTECQQPDGRNGVPADPDRGQIQIRSTAGRARPRDQLLQPGRPEHRLLEHVRIRPVAHRVRAAPAVRHIRLLAVRDEQVAGQPRDSVPLRGSHQRVRVRGPGSRFLGGPRLLPVIYAKHLGTGRAGIFAPYSTD